MSDRVNRLDSIDRDDQIEIARQVYRMAKGRQRARFSHIQRGSLPVATGNWQTLQHLEHAIRLPSIKAHEEKVAS